MPVVLTPARAARRATPAAVGTVCGLAAGLLYTVGWSRAFSWDASRTVGQFVTAPAAGGALGQDRFNNHPLFSLLEHLVHAATGSTDERLLRVLPILCGAVAVGLVAAATARRFGTVAGFVAGATLAVNAMAVRQFREVRGYALVTLAAVVATLALFRRLRQPSRGVTMAYVIGLAAAIGTHLVALGLVVVHALVVAGSKPSSPPPPPPPSSPSLSPSPSPPPPPPSPAPPPPPSSPAPPSPPSSPAPPSPPLPSPRRLARWLGPWAAALAVGLVLQGPAIVDGLRAPPPRAFAPAFPLRLVANLLGGFALPAMLVLVVAGALALRSRPWLPWVLAGTAAMVGASWLARFSWVDSRFFIWLAPGVAVAAGAAVARRPKLVPVVVAAVAVQLFALAPEITKSDVPNRIAAGFVRASQAGGASVCALGRTRAGLLAYVDDVPALWDFTRLPACDVAVEAAGPKPQPLLGAACRRFAFVLRLPARHPGAVFADRPLPLVPELLADAPTEGHRWEPTASARTCDDPPFPKGFPA